VRGLFASTGDATDSADSLRLLMFTGIVEGLGAVVSLTPQGSAVDLVIAPPAPAAAPPALGESVAINGCCLTVVRADEHTWTFQAGSETLSRTNLGALRAGDRVNVERSLRVGDRLGGHLVQGHIDGTGRVTAIDREGEWVHMRFAVPAPLTRQMVVKGSVAVDGVSLTLVTVDRESFSVALIPHTLEVTTLGARNVGDTVNVETDIIGKYLEKLSAVSCQPSDHVARF
jgi:riboflavin synthase